MASHSRLRVAHIITQLELGGAQRNTLYTVEHLDLHRFEPCLMSGAGGLLDNEAGLLKIPHFFIPSLLRSVRPFKDAQAFMDLYRHLRHFQPDIVHTHSSKAGILGRLAAYVAGVPVIIHTFHGFGFTPRQPRLVRWFYIGLEKLCAWLSTHLIYVSEDNRSEAAALGIGPHTTTSLIRSGIEITPTPWRGQERRKSSGKGSDKDLGIPPGAWVATYVGNFKPQKNPLDLAKVAERVLSQTRDVYFLLVGEGELRPEVEKYLALHNIQDRVKILGWCRRDDIRQILERSKVFLMTSLWEGLPRSLVEAFAANRPAVAYAVNGVRDILKDGENGFSIPSGDIGLAAEKLIWLKDHPDQARQMGERGRQLVEKEFDINLMVRQQEELYVKLFQDVPLKEYYKPHGSLTPS